MMKRFAFSADFGRIAAVVFFGNGLSAILGFLALRLYTELAPPDIYGKANLILGSLTLASQIAVQPIVSSQMRFHSEAAQAGNGDVFSAEALRYILLAAGALGAAATLVLFFMLWGDLSLATATGLSAGLWMLLTGLRSTFMTRLHAEQQMKRYMALRLFETVCTIVVTGLLLALFSPSPASFIIGQSAGFLGVLVFWIWNRGGPVFRIFAFEAPNAGLWAKVTSYGLSFVPLGVLLWISGLADRYVLAALLGTAAAGKYFAAFVIAAAGFGILNGAMGDLFRPKLFAEANAGRHAQAHRVFVAWLATYLLIAVCGVIAVAVLGPFLVAFAIGEAYRDGAVGLLVIISVGFTISGVNTAMENRLLSYGHSGKLLAPVAAGAAANVILSFILISANGIPGAAQASCLSFAVQLLCTYLTLRHVASAQSAALAAKPV
jgi:O-antigen/teichoic acid export membrane protein